MNIVFLQAAIAAILTIAVLRPLARHVGLIDQPDERKQHVRATPLVGGPAMFLALVIVLAPQDTPAAWAPLFLGSLLLLVTGMVDDIRRIGSTIRLVVQGIAVLLICVGGEVVISSLGYLWLSGQEISLGVLAASFTIFCGIGLVNAVNMADGLDGLSASLSLVAFVALGFAAAVAGRTEDLLLIGAVSGALVGFLTFNYRLPGRKQALVFLGDSGSYLVGFLLFYVVVRLSQGPQAAIAPVTALWICAIPLFDTVAIMLRRLRKGRSPFVADREHLHHVFLLAGFTVRETVAIMAGLASVGAALGVWGDLAGVPDLVMLAGFLFLAALYYRVITRAWTVMRFLNRSISRRRRLVDRRGGRDRRRRRDPSMVAKVGRDRRSGKDRRREPDRRHEIPPDVEGAAGPSAASRNLPEEQGEQA
jgi:UDP-GlcNAc:undecaprenyl-phosphate GlcNAc-1-phosphate transferase